LTIEEWIEKIKQQNGELLMYLEVKKEFKRKIKKKKILINPLKIKVQK
jgi:hypothetical protein